MIIPPLSAPSALAELKRRSYALLRAAPGQRLLDVGSGAGEDCVALAGIVGGAGVVEGIDRDPQLARAGAQLAERAGVAGSVRVQQADVLALPFADASLDGCRCERVLEQLDAPDVALAELRRVTRPGGWIVIAEADWATLSVDSADPLLDRELEGLRQASPSARIGRQLYRLLRRLGLRDLAVTPLAVALRDAELLALLAERAGRVAEPPRWHAALSEAAGAAELYGHLTVVLAAGRAP